MTDEGWRRLSSAILLQAADDWKRNARNINRAKGTNLINKLCELRQIIFFINSDWFTYLTQGEVPQQDVIKHLMKNIDHKYWRFILDHILPYYNKTNILKSWESEKIPNRCFDEELKKYVLLYRNHKCIIAETKTCLYDCDSHKFISDDKKEFWYVAKTSDSLERLLKWKI